VPLVHQDLAIPNLRSRPFSAPGWIFELKYDGFRVLAAREGEAVRLLSRRGNDMIACFPEIATSLLELPDLVIDGELVLLDVKGRPQFERLRRRLALKRFSIDHAARTEPAALFAFDLLELRGKDLRRLPLLERKAQLERLLRKSTRIRYLTHVGEDGERLYAAARNAGTRGYRRQTRRCALPPRSLLGLGEDQDAGGARHRRDAREVGRIRYIALRSPPNQDRTQGAHRFICTPELHESVSDYVEP